jgi:hypothetical protein
VNSVGLLFFGRLPWPEARRPENPTWEFFKKSFLQSME